MKIKIKYLFILPAILIILAFSELLYAKNSNPEYLSRVLLILCKESAKKNSTFSFKLLSLGSQVIIDFNKKNYPQLIPKNYSVKIKNTNNSEIIKYLSQIKTEPYYESISNNFSLILYDIAIIKSKNNREELTPKLLEISYFLKPTLSYWPVELANYYYLKGNREKAIEVLDNCIKLKEPKAHCEYFIKYISDNNEPLNLGFLTKEVKKFYKLE